MRSNQRDAVVLRVLMMPNWKRFNKYQTLLVEALGNRGIQVIFGRQLKHQHALLQIALRRDIDVLHIHWLHKHTMSSSLLGSIARSSWLLFQLFLLRIRSVRLIWTVHNIVGHDSLYPQLELLIRRLAARLVHVLLVHHPQGLETVSRAYRITIQKLLVSPHGHYIGAYPNLIRREEARNRLDISSEQRVFMFFGLVRPYKGVVDLITSFTRIEGSNLSLFIVGKADRAYRDRVVKAAEHDRRITLILNFIPDDEVQVFLRASDVVVIPRSGLTSGSAILAMSFGRPVIASASDHLSYLLGPEDELLYDPNDPDGLESALRFAAAATDLEDRGRRNMDRISKMTWDETAEVVATAYCQTYLQSRGNR